MNIVLTGFMASGKTTVGLAIAELSDYIFTDTDALIEEKAGMSINDIFKDFGEAHFRAIESKVIAELAGRDRLVVATGGGAVLNKENMDALRANGMIFNLAPDFSVIQSRVEEARATRPLMKNESIENIGKRFYERLPYYENCDRKIIVTENGTPRSYAIEILNYVKEENK